MTAALTATAALGSSVGPATAATTAGCSGAECDGQDPQRLGCGNDARTLETNEVGGWFTVELRFSPTCRAAWTRYDNYRGTEGQAVVRGYSAGVHRLSKYKTLAAYTGEKSWTPMVSFTYTVYACGRHYHDLWGWDEWCTGPH